MKEFIIFDNAVFYYMDFKKCAVESLTTNLDLISSVPS